MREAVQRAKSRTYDLYAAARANGKRWPARGAAVEEEAPAVADDAPAASLAEALTARLGDAPVVEPVVEPVPEPEEVERPEERAPVDPPAGAPRVEDPIALADEPATDADAPAGVTGAPVLAPQPGDGSAPLDWRTELDRLRELAPLQEFAVAREAAGELDAAHAAWLRSLALEGSSERRRAVERELERIDARMTLRVEIQRATSERADAFVPLGILSATEEGLRTMDAQDEVLAWSDVDATLLRALARASRLGDTAKLGLAAELLAEGPSRPGDALLADLLEDGAFDADAIDAVLAWSRAEPVPAGGYVWEGRSWEHGAVVTAAADDERALVVAKALPRADAKQRDELFDELFSLGRKDLCGEAVAARWEKAARSYETLRGRAALEKLAEARHEVDRLREELLARIEDTHAYPHDLTASGAAQRKAESQKYIDGKTRELRDLFDDTRPVTVRAGMRELVDEMLWLEDREYDLRLERTLRPPELPRWLAWLPASESDVRLEVFAWTRFERDLLAQDRAVQKRNRDLLQAEEFDLEESEPGREDGRQVLVTNAYRVLLGRRALGWNPKLQAAAYDHSEYMARTGDFGHNEPTPGRETPWARMNGRGYTRPGGENCYAGGSAAESAHEAWRNSPGHHRNLIAAGHQEMASSLVSRYWTQVFGSEQDYLLELEAWSD